MSTAKLTERSGLGMPALGMPNPGLPGMGMPIPGGPGMAPPPLGTPTLTTPGNNWLMLPRGTMQFEKVPGGMKVVCTCDDRIACGMMQNLCTMLAGGLCSCSVLQNGMTVCQFNFTMGLCQCDTTDQGIRLTCTSGDPKSVEMIQGFCACLAAMLEMGCTCCVLLNNTPVGCGGKAPATAKR